MAKGGNQNAENQKQQDLMDYFRPIMTDNYSGIRR